MPKHTRSPNYVKYVLYASDPVARETMVRHTRFDGANGCWEWQGSRNELGYGYIATHQYNLILAHRLALHLCGRPVPADRVVDHLCRNTSCVNPDHLAIVTPGENTLRGVGYFATNGRKTHCIRGHEFSQENTRIGVGRKTGRPTRSCRQCARDRYADSKHTAA